MQTQATAKAVRDFGSEIGMVAAQSQIGVIASLTRGRFAGS